MTGETRPVALVLVSHSARIAEGLVELAGQMAPDVLLLAAGGMPDGSLGTAYDTVEAALTRATADGGRAAVLTDLGSAVLTAESVLEAADPDVAARVVLVDAPLVEGAVAAAVTAAGGGDLAAVAAAARGALAADGVPADTPAPAPAADTAADTAAPDVAAPAAAPVAPAAGPATADADGTLRTTVTLRNPLGLHARPAAVLARTMAGFDARVRLGGANAASVIALMKLGATGGQSLDVEAAGPQARAALDTLVEAVEGGFGEV